MDDSIVLISSDDSNGPHSPVKQNALKFEGAEKVNSDLDSDDTVDYFPPVKLISEIKVSTVGQNVVTESSSTSSGGTYPRNKFHSLSDSDHSDCEVVQHVEQIREEELHKREEELHKREKNNLQQSSNDEYEWANKKGKKVMKRNAGANEEKARKKAEMLEIRAKRKAEQAKEKAAKKLATEIHRSMKPGECMKYIHVHLDSQLLSAEYSGELLNGLQAAEVQYVIKDHIVPFSIMWTRKVLQQCIGADDKMEMASVEQEENEVLLVSPWDEVVDLVHNNRLTNHIKTVQHKLKGKNLTLVIYGAEQYFRFQKTNKRKEVRNQVLGTEVNTKLTKTGRKFESAPKISRQEWERALAESELFTDCCHRLIDEPQAMGMFVKQFTKAIAERPFKQEKQRREQEALHWYAAGNSRDCVRVDKDGNGVHRLWQQQLCQFSRVGMDVAEAIVSVYKTPRELVQAYENCSTQNEGMQLLASIPVRRGVGPLTTVRRVGPDLSRKIHTFFTAIDGDMPLSQE